jgi:hypothetical protein
MGGGKQTILPPYRCCIELQERTVVNFGLGVDLSPSIDAS